MLILLLVLVFRIWVLAAPRRRIHSGGGKYFPAAPASLLLSSNLTRELHTPNLKGYSDPISTSKTLPHSADSSKEKKTLGPLYLPLFLFHPVGLLLTAMGASFLLLLVDQWNAFCSLLRLRVRPKLEKIYSSKFDGRKPRAPPVPKR